MSESIVVVLGSPLPLSFTTPDGSSGRFIRATVYDSTQTLVATKDIGPSGEVGSTGRYADSTFTPGAVGNFTAHYIAYTDGTYTIKLTTFEQDQDSFSVLDPALFGYLAADRTRDNQVAVETTAIDGRLPPDPADESVQLAAHAATQGAGFVTGTDSLEAISNRVDTLLAGVTLTSGERTTLAAVIRDIGLAGSAIGSLGEGILIAKNAKLFFRIDKYVRDSNGFALSARIRIFKDSADATASNQDAGGLEGAIADATWTGIANALPAFAVLPQDVVGV